MKATLEARGRATSNLAADRCTSAGKARTQTPLAWRMRTRWKREHGSAVVEMALVLPLMLLIMTGIATFSMALYQKLLLAEAVGSAGRFIAGDRGQTDPCSDTWTALTQSAPGLSAGSISMTIKYTHSQTGTSATYTSNTCTAIGGSPNTNVNAMQPGDYGLVYASYPCVMQVLNVWGHGAGSQACTVTAAVAEDIQ